VSFNPFNAPLGQLGIAQQGVYQQSVVGYQNYQGGYTPMTSAQYTGNGNQQGFRIDPAMTARAWEIYDQQFNAYLNNTWNMTDKKELTADEKMIVRALKNEKTPSEIAMLVVVARLTQRTPATVMEVLDDVTKLVTDKIGEGAPAVLTAGA
jgi:hypothetical protein